MDPLSSKILKQVGTRQIRIGNSNGNKRLSDPRKNHKPQILASSRSRKGQETADALRTPQLCPKPELWTSAAGILTSSAIIVCLKQLKLMQLFAI